MECKKTAAAKFYFFSSYIPLLLIINRSGLYEGRKPKNGAVLLAAVFYRVKYHNST